MKKNYTAIDIAKFICALLVVGIHTQPLGDRLSGGGYFLTTLCRIAVPFFFVVSGFLFFSKETKLSKYVKRLIILDITWTVLELPYIIYNCFFLKPGSFLSKSFHLLQSLFWGESYMGSWFVHASWMGMITLCWLLRHFKNRTVGIVCVLCFIFALLDTSYRYLLIGTCFDGFWDVLNKVIYPSESFIVALPYFFLGRLIALKTEESKKIVSKKYVSLCVLACFSLFVEAIIVRNQCDITQIINPRFEQFVILIPFILIFTCCIKDLIVSLSHRWSLLIRQESILIYLLHQPLILFTYIITGYSEGPVLFLLVALESIIIAYLIIVGAGRFKYLKYLY